jgi:hypothetical protein
MAVLSGWKHGSWKITEIVTDERYDVCKGDFDSNSVTPHTFH